jgi:hypothetical protein
MGIKLAAENPSDCTTILKQVRNEIILSGTNASLIEEVIFDLKKSEYRSLTP